ncbi:DUF45 domain-containing protein [Silanimonas algicola]
MAIGDAMPHMPPLKYLVGYPDNLQQRVRMLIDQGRLGPMLAQRYPDRHAVRSDGQLYEYVQGLKDRHLRQSPPLGKVVYDGGLHVLKHALGTHTIRSRVQGRRLKVGREIRIAALFKEVAPEFLQMIAVHELAHLREGEHNKAFYQLCTHMAPEYHQWELDLRLYLTLQDVAA